MNCEVAHGRGQVATCGKAPRRGLSLPILPEWTRRGQAPRACPWWRTTHGGLKPERGRGLLKKPPQGEKCLRRIRRPGHIKPPSSVCKQILAPHSVWHSSFAFDPRGRHSSLIPSRRARAPYRGRAGGASGSASKGSAPLRYARLRRLLRVRVDTVGHARTRGTRSLPGPAFFNSPEELGFATNA